MTFQQNSLFIELTLNKKLKTPENIIYIFISIIVQTEEKKHNLMFNLNLVRREQTNKQTKC